MTTHKEAFNALMEKAGFNPLCSSVTRSNVVVTFPRAHSQKAESLKLLLASAGLKEARSWESFEGAENIPVVRVSAWWQ